MGEAGNVYKSGSLVAQAAVCVPVVVVAVEDWRDLVKLAQANFPWEKADMEELIKRIEAANG